ASSSTFRPSRSSRRWPATGRATPSSSQPLLGHKPLRLGRRQRAAALLNPCLSAQLQRTPLHLFMQPGLVAEREEHFGGKKDRGDKNLEQVVHERGLAALGDVDDAVSEPGG